VNELTELVAAAFDIGRPTGPMTPVRHVSQETWRLNTTSGSALVKRFWQGPEVPWQPSLERSMAIEQNALAAGIDTPTPLPPLKPQFGSAAHIDGHGVFRAYPYIEHRPLQPDDDIMDWVGSTTARIHQLEPPLTNIPEPSWWYNQFPATPPEQWREWLALGAGQPWIASLADNLPLILAQSARVTDTFRNAGPYVWTHRDFEPWNVLMTPTGDGWRPVLIDWDVAGSDSAPLETAHILLSFARNGGSEPDSDRVRTGLRSYVGAGGLAPAIGPDLLVRQLGMRLSRISDHIRASLDEDNRDRAAKARDGIGAFAELTASFTSWACLFADR
jgi:Ser/Thr protein kinase RdoA (MazF antagonist)